MFALWSENVIFCKIADDYIVWLPWLQKIDTFRFILFFAFEKKNKCWLLRLYLINSYILVLLGDNLV